jgi:hypothetical protein
MTLLKESRMIRKHILAAVPIALSAFAFQAAAQTPPPAPSLLAPAAGAALVQPITLTWSAVVDPDGPIGSYQWQVSATSTFTTIAAAGATNQAADTIPAATHDKVSGLPNGTYFWRVKATQLVGGVVFALDSPWSAVRSFTVTGLGPAPGTPSFTSPANGSQFHVREFFLINWTGLVGAHHYLLEADDEPTFSPPLTLTTDLMQFGTTFRAGWGNEIPNIYYRIVAVSADNVRGLPSSTLNVHITNVAPVPPPPVPLSPVGGASISLPFTFDWTDTANPQIAGYDLDIDDEPNFLGAVGVLLVQGVTRSDYMVVQDPLIEGINHFPPGTYFWRVRAVHGDAFGPWSAGATFTVVASPPSPTIFWIIAEPGSVSGSNSTQARVTLDAPAPAGGAVIKIASDFPHAQTPASVTIPAGKTDATVSPITTIPVPGATIGTLRAANSNGWQQSSLGLFPILWGLSLSAENVIGGATVLGTATLLNPAPPGGITVTLVNGDTSVLTLPPSIFIPAGGTGGTFNVLTTTVSVPTFVTVGAGTGFEGYRSPGAGLTLLPVGSPAPAPALTALTLAAASVVGSGGGTTGTVTLTAPAPAGGALIRLSGSMEGEVVVPQDVTVPAGSISASFRITAPQVNAPRYVLIQATYGFTGATHAELLEIDPGPPGPATLLAFGVNPTVGVIGGNPMRGTVGLVMPAPLGGGVVTLTSSDPSLVQVPPSVAIAAGNSANSFTITTSPVAFGAFARIDASAGGITKTAFINLGPDPNAPSALLSVTLSVSGVTGGNSVPGTVFLTANAPPGGASVTLATSNLSAAQVPPVVIVPAGLGFASFTVTTSAVSANTQVTITGFLGSSTQSASLTVLPGSVTPPTPGTPSLLSPANDAQPAQPITLDWSNASNAASYDIQVDDSSSFTTPLVRSLTSTASQTSVSGLSAVRHWWRVRARNSAGVAGNWSASRRFVPLAAPAAASLSAVSVSPTSVVGGSSVQGTVTLTSGAPAGGAVVSLSSSNVAVAAVPATVTVAAGVTSATFNVTSTAVGANTSVTLTATYNAVSRTATLTVTPPPAPASLSSVTLNPTTVSGGATSQGTVTLTSAAPAGGAVVTLSSSNINAATVPASVTVSAGATSAGFTIASKTVTTSTAVTITATSNAVQRTATLTVNPAAAGPLPAPSLVSPANDTRFPFGQLITFDWSDVAGAAGYTIQIDDQTFTAPFILTQTTTSSVFSTSSLARADMFWRVRANDAAGNPGAWSASRRVRVE